jgi:hypothetical protein
MILNRVKMAHLLAIAKLQKDGVATGPPWREGINRNSPSTSPNDPPHHHNNQKSSTSTLDNFTNMVLIFDAMAAIDARELGDKLTYRAAEKRFGVNKDTLRRRHQGLTRSNAGEAEQRCSAHNRKYSLCNTLKNCPGVVYHLHEAS